jgi:hypothetical protein
MLLAVSLAGCASSSSGLPADGGGDDVVVPDAAEDAVGDGFPTGAIAFFLDTQCPTGWELHADAVGRTIVPSPGPEAGEVVGTPLAANEQRGHSHAVEVGVDLGSVSFAGVAGEANHGVARGGAVEGATATDSAVATPPYAQLLVCEKTAPSGNRTAPSGVIAFFAAETCPSPWIGVEPALVGRFLVGLPEGGDPRATFGGPSLAPGEVRSHGHAVTATLDGGSHGIALASGCCAGGYAAAGSHGATASASAATVEMPYLQLLACRAP